MYVCVVRVYAHFRLLPLISAFTNLLLSISIHPTSSHRSASSIYHCSARSRGEVGRCGRERRGVELSSRDHDVRRGLSHAAVKHTIGTKQRARYDGTYYVSRITRHSQIPRLRRMAGFGGEEVAAGAARCEKMHGGGPQKASVL